jgi:acrylyl-CoA reductase (NADPH)
MSNTVFFEAMWVEEVEPGHFKRSILHRNIQDLPENEVLVRVKYSSLNYKDALSASGNRGVTRKYPHTPGIDASGIVVESIDPDFHPGDEVLVAAEGMGVDTPGGFGQFVRVPAAWLIKIPVGLSLRESMAYGTAGFTAALCVDQLLKSGVTPTKGEVLVTGATGGVGTIAVAILALNGFEVTAATGKLEQEELLKSLGARQVIHRDSINDTSEKPLLSGLWAGVVDTVGGNYLATAIRATKPEGVVTACGNAASPDLHLTVFPFILRGVRLVGIDATRIPYAERVRLWTKLGSEWHISGIERMIREVHLGALSAEIDKTLQGRQSGRVIVNLD